MRDSEILEKLYKRAVAYFKDDLFLNVEESSNIKEVDSIQFLDITSLISLSRDINGIISMSISNKLAHKMVEDFLDDSMDENEIKELACSNVAETLNIVLGNTLGDLECVKNGGSVNISSPFIMHNAVDITKKRDGYMVTTNLKVDNELVLFSYFA